MEVEKEIKKLTLGHEVGSGAPCLKCKDKCEGFELHFWRSFRKFKVRSSFLCLQTLSSIGGLLQYPCIIVMLLYYFSAPGTFQRQKKECIFHLALIFLCVLLSPSYVSSALFLCTVKKASESLGLYLFFSSLNMFSFLFSVKVLPLQRKVCRNCKCGLEDHDVQTGSAEDKKVGKLLEDTKYTTLIAKLKTDGVPQYRRNMVTLTNAVPAKKDVDIKSVTYEWAPPVANQSLAMRYIEMLPKEKQPVVGTEGAAYRKKQMAKQLPEHDQDPSKCHELSPNEVKQMQQYVKKYKEEALGVGDVALPEEMEAQAGEKGPREAGDRSTTTSAGAMGAKRAPRKGAAYVSLLTSRQDKTYRADRQVSSKKSWDWNVDSGSDLGLTGDDLRFLNSAKTMCSLCPPRQSCHRCQLDMREGDPAVYAERAGYDKLWHPACFVCSTCTELLVDMIYFWKNNQLYCGRHYGDSEKPRCGGCDEVWHLEACSYSCAIYFRGLSQLIFSNEYTQAEGQNWHLKHFCCFDCDCVLAGETYVMVNEKPVCRPCYMKSHAARCNGCQNAVEPEAQRVTYGSFNWHAEPECFQCSCCSKCLVGQRFMAVEGMLFCSVECKKKTMS
uniref:Testin n=1 Tax=Lepisosteus oculatus TaxID=7918 RepID=W5NEZ8_LEPOC